MNNVIEILNPLNNVGIVVDEKIYVTCFTNTNCVCIGMNFYSEIIPRIKSNENIYSYLVELSKKFISK